MTKRFDLGEEELQGFFGNINLDSLDVEDLPIPKQDKEAASELGRLQRLSSLLARYEELTHMSGVNKWFVPGTPFGIENCPRHKAFFAAGTDYNERLFLAGNRCGKSIAGAFEVACHATGIYPDWWTGRRFDRPTHGWAVGSTARATRDTVQKELLGPVGQWGSGMIPNELLGRWWALAGVPQGVDIIQVKHVSGGWSTIGFKNYEQPLSAFFGTALEWVWLDEECPSEHYNECLIRTMTTNGIILNTFTPLKGLTAHVVRFSEKADYLAGAEKLIGVVAAEGEDEDSGEDARIKDIKSHKAIIQAGWDHAPWLSDEKKTQMLDDTEPHLREARRSGKPSMGSGNVYPIAIESIMCTPFQIPSYFKWLYAMDVGWNRTACLWAAIDPQSDTVYIVDEYYVGESPPPLHAAAIRARGTWKQGVIDPASRGRTQTDGQQIIKQYKDLGLHIHPANNEVDAGLQGVWQRMTTGNLKVFNTLPNFAKEFVLYRRDLKGKIVKENDHLMDCLRYLQNNLVRAKSIDQLRSTPTYSGGKRYNI
jgi:phage terminase large subunit-like protein